ncbi:hypothetical protein OS493_028894 [Desmophyllum pertusum]|uniref:Uncharacterized protein n=1 Tax=Desmophyllum pertusum TaxID=174260 RepID=A0A9W9ZCA4_9CNID|nr:hypothetical protein OS493_028894 [Desmophyllum pertusum]
MCGVCSARGDMRKCSCQQPPAKKKKTTKKAKGPANKGPANNQRRAVNNRPRPANNQPRPADRQQPPAPTSPVSPLSVTPRQPPSATSTPEADVNYKSICRQLRQKNQQLGKAYQDIKAQYDDLGRICGEKDEQLQQAQEDSDEMAQFVREADERVAEYSNRIRDGDERIEALERQLREVQGQPTSNTEPPAAAAAKVDRNDLEEIHRRMAATARSTIRDFLGIAELRIVNEITYESTIERLADPKLSVKAIEKECWRQLAGLLLMIKRLRQNKTLLPLAVDDSFYS